MVFDDDKKWPALFKLDMLKFRSLEQHMEAQKGMSEAQALAIAVHNSTNDMGGPSTNATPPDRIAYSEFIEMLRSETKGDHGTNPKIANFLTRLFSGIDTSQWEIINPRGDGFCGVSAVAYDRMTFELGDNKAFIEKLKPALSSYFEHADTIGDRTLVVDGEDDDHIAIFQPGKTDSNNAQLDRMVNWSTISSNFFGVLAYAFNCNIITLTFDPRAEEFNPIVTAFVNKEFTTCHNEDVGWEQGDVSCYTWSSNWAILINTSCHWKALSKFSDIRPVVERLIFLLHPDSQKDVRNVLGPG